MEAGGGAPFDPRAWEPEAFEQAAAVRFRLSKAAASGLDGFRAWWGRAQRLAYCGELARTFERIAAEPETGRRRDGFRPGMR